MSEPRCKTRRWRPDITPVVVLLLLALPLLLGFKQYSNEAIVRHFDIIVFNSEHRQMTVKEVRKWVVPIRIYLDVRVPNPEHYRKLTQATVDKLAAASGLDIRIVHRKEVANVVSTFDRMDGLLASAEAYFPADEWIKQLINTNLCISRFFANDRGEIYKANIFIPTDRSSSAGMLPACVIEETAQILGLPNDSDEIHFSIFND
ncbi:MAG: DUF2927 domain-containing protein, partial [Kiloniellales bacterium]